MRNTHKIVKSLFDTDFYKFTMLQFVWTHARDNIVTFRFKNRTSVNLLKFMTIEQLQAEFEKIRVMKIDPAMVDKLRHHPVVGKYFKSEFLQWLVTDFHLAPIRVFKERGKLAIESSGRWVDVTLWETFIMNVVNRLYFLQKMKNLNITEEAAYEEGLNRLVEKCEKLSKIEALRFMEFGTRRRWSHEWQKIVIKMFMVNLPKQLIGTSNVHLALELGLTPRGTMAHEMDMGLQGVFFEQDTAAGYMWSHEWLKEEWLKMYPELSIFLSDTYGSTYFFDHLTQSQAERSVGTRQDSGNPVAYGNKAKQRYDELCVETTAKALVFSDGLTDDLMISLTNEFISQFQVTHGLGTHGSNDMGFDNLESERGLKPLSIVVKLTRSNGHGTVKCSDNPKKMQGTKRDIARICRLTGYNPDEHESVACVV